MSSFGGRMREYPTISLDRFDKDNLHARAYFLSHCHKDHMRGLKAPAVKRKLACSLAVKLYCSPVTKELLLSNPKYGFWQSHTVALELESPTQIPLVDEMSGEREDIVVTLLPAGHCPGSVMFLIEGNRGVVLYTGDFRLATGEVARMEFLHTGNGVKDIQSVYLDTTFFDSKYFQIPSREACLSGVKELVRSWIALSRNHVVWLNCKAAYGYEYLFKSLCEEFGCQDVYFRSPRLPCGDTAKNGAQLHIISIKPSTIWFGERSRKTNVIMKTGRSSYRACFSFHSSFSELKDFLSYICPVNIYPSVIPVGRTLQEIQEILKPFCREYSGRGLIVYKPLGILKKSKWECDSKGSDSDCDLFDEDDLTPWRRKAPVKRQLTCIRPLSPEEMQSNVCLGEMELNLNQPGENYVDCIESNDDEDEEEEQPESFKEGIAASSKEETLIPISVQSIVPKWESFFTVDPVIQDESPQPENSPTGMVKSQSSSDDDSTHVSSQSTHISEAGTDVDTMLLPLVGSTQDMDDDIQVDSDILLALRDTEGPPGEGLDSLEKLESQESSDFDIPSTPDSHVPQPEELKDLYRKLAAGEPIVLKRMS